MSLDRLVLTDFRNYRRLVWHPEAPVAVLHGENGSGKTNLLEAVSLLVPGRGLRGAALSDLGRNGAAEWGVSLGVTGPYGATDIATGMTAAATTSSRQFRLDGLPLRSRERVGEHLACVWLTPQMERLFQDGASARRRFFDRLVLALEPHHARELAAYDRSLAQRNRLLAGSGGDGGWLDAVENSMARHAVALTAARRTLTTALNAHDGVGHGFPETTLSLLCPVSALMDTLPALAVEDRLRDDWGRSRHRDAARGGTAIGPHRADVVFSERLSGRPGALSSTGQQKAMLLGVIFAHAQVMGAVRGQMPVLLLDEPMVHLDEQRRMALMHAVAHAGGPVLLTGTDTQAFAGLRDRAAFHAVHEGAVVRS
nr:DNA replication/repair protein RecF [Ameyamaea chiangmaiensis]